MKHLKQLMWAMVLVVLWLAVFVPVGAAPSHALAPSMVDKAARTTARVRIAPSTATVKVGSTIRLTATVVGGDGPSDIAWSIDRGDTIGSVDEHGVVTGLKPGAVYVKALDRTSDKSLVRKVTVKAIKVTSVKLAQTSVVLDVGETVQLTQPTILPADAVANGIKWKSDNVKKVTIDERGVITGVAAGTTRITCTVGGKKASCKVRVRGDSAVFTLSAVGDVIMGGDPRPKSALNRVTKDVFAELLMKNGTDYPFKNVKQVFLNDDLTIANLECTLSARSSSKEKNKTHVLRGEPSYAAILKGAGIDVCNLANNHTQDLGRGGLEDTQKSLNAVGIKWCDGVENGTYTITKDGVTVKIGFAGFQTPTDTVAMTARIKQLNKKCDVVIVSFHWCDTPEWVAKNFPSDARRAKAAIKAGADLVLGSHRHVPAGIEKYAGKYIVYDLANFIVGIKHKAAADGRPLTDSMIFQWQFRVDTLGVLEDVGIKVIPCTTTTSTETYQASDDFGDMGAPINNWQPAILTGTAAQGVLDRIRALSGDDVSIGS